MRFVNNLWTFELKTPKYEEDNFGCKVGELRLVEPNDEACFQMKDIFEVFDMLDIEACTFRGREETQLVRFLNKIGFQFVGTYRYFECKREDFKPCAVGEVVELNEEDNARIELIERNVFDFSTYQIDGRFNNDQCAMRNANRVKSYFDHPNYYSYGVTYDGFVVGFIQFIVDPVNRTAENVNSALLTQDKGLGKILYSGGFGKIFDLKTSTNSGDIYEIDKVTGWVSTQNPRPAKILDRMGFRFIDQEIHLRWKR